MPPISCRRQGRIARLLIDRPEALNAMDRAMVDALHAALAEWRDVPEVHAVVIEGAGGRAFCAGGDIRALRAQLDAGDLAAVDGFFAAEYALDLAVARYPKPVVALVDGVCMGGGVGISVHGAVRVATEAAVFAMPEAAIGLFPDVGASFLLPRLPGALGFWMGLTGARVRGADAVHLGLATHFVPRAALPVLADALAADGLAALAGFAAPLPAFTRAADRAAIDACFAEPGMETILARLAAAEGEWAREAERAIAAASPSAVLWTDALLRRGAGRSLEECLAAEARLVRHAIRQPDFAEGVRAMVIDKDRSPRWTPARLADVDRAMIASVTA